MRILGLLGLLPMLAIAEPEPITYAPKLTWEHDCLDVVGEAETLSSWSAMVKAPDGSEVSSQVLPEHHPILL